MQVVRMGRISFPAVALLVLGVVLVTIAFTTIGNVPIAGIYGQYISLTLGPMLIVLAFVLVIRNRK